MVKKGRREMALFVINLSELFRLTGAIGSSLSALQSTVLTSKPMWQESKDYSLQVLLRRRKARFEVLREEVKRLHLFSFAGFECYPSFSSKTSEFLKLYAKMGNLSGQVPEDYNLWKSAISVILDLREAAFEEIVSRVLPEEMVEPMKVIEGLKQL